MQSQAIVCIFAFMVQLILLTLSAPVQTIDNPCGLDPNAAMEPMPNADLLRDAITQANSAVATCQVFMDKMRTDRVLTADEFSYFADRTLQLPGLPIRQAETNVSRANFGNVMRQHYNDTSLVIMYLNTAILDQTAYDNGRYLTELQNTQKAFYSSLCKIYLITKRNNVTITQFLNSSAVPSQMKNLIDTKRRYYRNVNLTSQAQLMAQTEAMNYAKFIGTV